MTEPLTTPSGWKKYDSPIPFHEWKGYINGYVAIGMIVHYRLVYTMPDGTTKTNDEIMHIGEANFTGIVGYDSVGIKFWEFPIRDVHNEKIYPECFIIAETDVLVPIIEQLKKEATYLTATGLTEQRFCKTWDGEEMKFQILETRNKAGELLITSRVVKEFQVNNLDSLDYLRADREASALLIRLSTGEETL